MVFERVSVIIQYANIYISKILTFEYILLAVHSQDVHKVRFSAAKRLIVTCSDDFTIKVFDVSTWSRVLKIVAKSAVNDICVDFDKNRIISA